MNLAFTTSSDAVRSCNRSGALWLVICLLATMHCLAASSSTNAPNRWPPIKEVLKKWDDIPIKEVERAANGGDLTAQHYLGYCYSEGHRGLSDAAQGIAWYERAGKGGYMPSLSNIGFLYQRGKGVPQDSSRAIAYFQRAADGGMADGLSNIGFLYRDGTGVPRDPAAALKWFRLAADKGDATGMIEIGRAYRFSQGVPKDNEEAERWFRKAIGLSDPRAEINLGLLLEEEGNSGAAFKLFQRAADQGSGDAMFKVYQSYFHGSGVPMNEETAWQWLEKGAEAGSATAQCQWGYHLEHPDDGPKNVAGAVKWYQRSADQNHAGGQYYLALGYLEGKGVEKDEARGVELMRQAADQSHAYAMVELAQLYARGIGEPRNEQDRSLKIWQRVAGMKLDDAYRHDRAWVAYRLIVFHLLAGLGTQRDWVEAARWYSRAVVADKEGFSLDDDSMRSPLRPAFEQFYGAAEADRNWVLLERPDALQYNDGFAPVLSLYRDAASKKSAAANAIAEMYLAGRNTPASPRDAWLWFNIAAQNSSTDARAKAAALESRLSADELKQARLLLPDLVRDLNAVATATRAQPVHPTHSR